ncbi:MAG: hypothetical protein LBD67_09720 [Candidatus Accumulibacter sp.]|nr:hypothetical protein [Accumulibacter sp.]
MNCKDSTKFSLKSILDKQHDARAGAKKARIRAGYGQERRAVGFDMKHMGEAHFFQKKRQLYSHGP